MIKLKYVHPTFDCCLAVEDLSQEQVDFINNCTDIDWWDEDRITFQDTYWDHLYFGTLDENVTAMQHLELDLEVMITFEDIFIDEE